MTEEQGLPKGGPFFLRNLRLAEGVVRAREAGCDDCAAGTTGLAEDMVEEWVAIARGVCPYAKILRSNIDPAGSVHVA